MLFFVVKNIILRKSLQPSKGHGPKNRSQIFAVCFIIGLFLCCFFFFLFFLPLLSLLFLPFLPIPAYTNMEILSRLLFTLVNSEVSSPWVLFLFLIWPSNLLSLRTVRCCLFTRVWSFWREQETQQGLRTSRVYVPPLWQNLILPFPLRFRSLFHVRVHAWY